jgi:hypothetical protein
MKTTHESMLLKLLTIWNSLRTMWVFYMVLLDTRALIQSGDPGPYPGLGIDAKLLVSLSAVPGQVLGLAAGMYSGRKAQLLCELLATIAYGLTAYCLWRRVRATRILASALYVTELALLALYFFYVVPMVSGPWPELRSLGLISGTAFLCISFLSLTYVLRLRQSDNSRLMGGAQVVP